MQQSVATSKQVRKLKNNFLTNVLDRDQSKETESGVKTCAIVLNNALPTCTAYLWKQANIRICADGGAERLRNANIPECPPPHYIVGDLDSVSMETQTFFVSKGTEIVNLSHDQDTTDLEKCFKVITERLGNWTSEYVHIILGAFGGKLDREMSNLHVAMKFMHLETILIGDESMTRLLTPGCNEITLNPSLEGPGCALVPLGTSCTVTSTGLKWDLNNHVLSFGSLVSTSNEALGTKIKVDTNNPLLWITDSNLG